MKVRLKYLITDKDRHDRVRYYVRKPGHKKICIKEQPHTEEFMAAYHEAMRGPKEQPVATRLATKGSFRALCVDYFAGGKFKALDENTRVWQRSALDAICQKHGDKPVALMQSRHVRKIRNEKESTPAVANMWMKAMRSMFTWSNEEEVFEGNPTAGVKNIAYKTKGHHTWTDTELESYRARHSLGTPARLAIELLRYSAARREDIPRLGPKNIVGGRLRFRQGKNEHRNPVDIDIPLHPTLEAAIAAGAGGESFLVTRWGKAYSTKGFGNQFKEWCRQAGLPHCSAHGVRKATASELATNLVTPHGIGSVTGHMTLKEIENYTRKANRAKLADEAVPKLK